jgi:hypothetical protein
MEELLMARSRQLFNSKSLSLSLIFLLSSIFVLQSALATQSMMEAMVFTYPNIKETELAHCSTCHNSVKGDFLNSYGKDLQESKLSFKIIEQMDSDADGVNNLDEIKDLTGPGQATRASEIFILNKNGHQGTITFDHKAHQFNDVYRSKENCVDCHRLGDFSKYISDPTSPSYSKLKEHKTCYGCHSEANHTGNHNAPMKCFDCHNE